MKHVVLHTIKYIYMYGYNIQLNCIDIIIDIKILDLSYLKKLLNYVFYFSFMTYSQEYLSKLPRRCGKASIVCL